MPLYAEVILPLALPQNFTYHIPDEFRDQVKPGVRVSVQVGKRKQYTAVVHRLTDEVPKDVRIKSILRVEDEHPLVNQGQLDFWKWIAGYYMCSMGEVMNAALPAGLKLESETLIIPNLQIEFDESILNDHEFLIWEALEQHSPLSISQINEITGLKNSMRIIHLMLGKHLILLQEEMKGGYRARTRRMVQINDQYHGDDQLSGLFDKLHRAPKQKELLLAYFRLSQELEQNIVPTKRLTRMIEGGEAALRSLEKKEILDVFEEEVALSLSEQGLEGSLPKLNTYQQEAFDSIKAGLDEGQVALLHGITSSGKTEIYAHFISEMLRSSRQVLYLVPEIALTTQLISRLKRYFGESVLVYHSRFSDRERIDTWRKLLEMPDKPVLVVGARSSVFLPFTNLGLVIVDEEHETSYKQYDPAPRYHARDSAIWLAHHFQANTILGSATPSVESMHHARNGKYRLIALTKRFADLPLPLIECVDLKDARRKKLMHGPFSKTLLEEIRAVLKDDKQVILFQNRRGFSTLIQCQNCGHIAQCKNCDISLTYHKHSDQLRCHYCGYTRGIPKQCPACQSYDIKALGFGTEKLEEELKLLIPEARVQRMDLDTTRRKNAYEKILTDFEDGEVDVLVGTQMVTKGLDFDRVALVGILNADTLLNFPDFRSHERAFQLMAQVAGRAGRKGSQGKVLIQTSEPYHSIIRQVMENNYEAMYQDQVYERKNYKYPPYYRLVRITLKHRDVNILNSQAKEIGSTVRQQLGSRVLGPEFPLIARLRNLYQMELLIKIEAGISLPRVKHLVYEVISKSIAAQESRIQVIYDVDPY
jgi:primosomal protein N' (replication factor Y)